MRMKNKLTYLLPLVLAILLTMAPRASAQDIWYPETEPTKAPDDFSDYETVEVTRGSVSYGLNTTASVHYPVSEDVFCLYSGVRLQKFTVESGAVVKAGDIIAYLYRPCSQTDLARMKLNLQRAEESMQEGITQRQDAIKQLQAQAEAETDSREREILRLTIEYQKTELELYRYQQQKSVDSRAEALAYYDPIPVYAPISGTVSASRFHPEDELAYNDKLLTIQDKTISYLRLKFTSDIAYNLPFTVTATEKGRNGQPDVVHTLTGRVIATECMAPKSLLQISYSDGAYLLLDEGQQIPDVTTFQLSSNVRQLDDVLILPEEAFLNRVNYSAYVQVLLPDGSSEQRLVTLGISDVFYNYSSQKGSTRYFWVVDGVSEGDTVVLWE